MELSASTIESWLDHHLTGQYCKRLTEISSVKFEHWCVSFPIWKTDLYRSVPFSLVMPLHHSVSQVLLHPSPNANKLLWPHRACFSKSGIRNCRRPRRTASQSELTYCFSAANFPQGEPWIRFQWSILQSCRPSSCTHQLSLRVCNKCGPSALIESWLWCICDRFPNISRNLAAELSVLRLPFFGTDLHLRGKKLELTGNADTLIIGRLFDPTEITKIFTLSAVKHTPVDCHLSA